MPRCPICEASADASSKVSPFCSERCRLIDLGNWLDERYRIATLDDEADSFDDPTGEGAAS